MATPLFDLAGKHALVTGGARGIGRAICHALADHGAVVMVADLDAEGAARTAGELAPGRPGCAAVAMDVTDPAAVATGVAETIRRFGRLDILVNNAGINTGAEGRLPIDQFSEADWRRILAVDLDGLFHVSRAAIPHLKAANGGRIINIASVLGIVPARLQSAYVAAKAAVIQLTRSMAMELAPAGILVNAVAPGSTMTEAMRTSFLYTEPEKARSLLSHIPLGRPGEMSEMAAAVVFLAAPASSYVTGIVLPVDGGWTAGYIRDW